MTRRSTLQLFALACLAATFGDSLDRSDSYGNDRDAFQTPVANRQAAHPNRRDGVDGQEFRLREGMKLVNQIGELKEAGGRIVFYPDGEAQPLQLLENLALERVSEGLDQAHRKWSVTGIVTEYRERNYLLLHRAVLKSRVSAVPGPRS